MILALDGPVLAVWLVVIVVGALLVQLAKATPWVVAISTVILAVGLAFAMTLWMGSLFAGMRALAWYLFLALPIILGLYAGFVESWERWVAGGLAGVLVLVGVDAFFVEPVWLTVRTERLVSDKVDEPLTIAILADIQTDHPGAYERRAIRLALDAQPDLILLPGDFIQHHDPAVNRQMRAQLAAIFDEEGLDAPLGVFAVQGNVDHPVVWTDLFADLPAHADVATTVHAAAPVSVTALSFHQGFDAQARVSPQPGFHVAFAHAPDFALGDVQADLLVAGHTHGGQVQIPILGPLITFSQVPNSWAWGRTDLGGGRTLIVSRGVGMERDYAPRLRFWCRPEVVIVEVEPG